MSYSRRRGPARSFAGCWALLWLLIGLVAGCDRECSYDAQCGAGGLCLGGHCHATCDATSDCESGEECVGKWDAAATAFSRVPICQLETCACDDPKAVCVDTDGALACTVNEPCQVGTVCEEEGVCGALGLAGCVCESGECGPECSREEQCGDDLVCRGDRCQHLPCDDDGDCDGGNVCGAALVAGTVDKACLSPGSLPTGEKCRDHAECRSRVCGAAPGGDSVCLDVCDGDEDCTDGTRCVFGAPPLGMGIGVCLETGQCSESELPVGIASGIGCTLGQACGESADCLAPLECVDGACTCSTCAAECDVDADCDDAFTCVGGICRLRPTCTNEDDCGSEQRCVSWLGRDVSETYCVGTGDRELGAACDRPEVCETGFCAGVCTLPCEASLDCPGSACAAAADGRTYCSLDDCPCRDDEICGGGRCAVSRACLRSSDCESDEACVGGICLRECERGSDCEANHDCVALDGVGDHCVGGEERCNCSPEEICIAGECRTANPCEGDGDCANSTCVDGHCFDTCEANAECPADMECVALQRGARLVRGCAAPVCRCDDENAWCLPSATELGTCFRDDDCDRCEDIPGYQCQTLTVPVSANGESLSRACGCKDPARCGAVCETSSDCPLELGLECAPFGRCAAVGSCRSTDDCAPLEDCMRDPRADAPLGTCERADCGCGPEASCVFAQGRPECVVGTGCSVLQAECPDGYECEPGLGLCSCRDALCAPECDDDDDCVPSQLCSEGACISVACSEPGDCPEGNPCGGLSTNLTCFQPGATEDAGLCDVSRECRSGYCFAGNACALLCGGSDDCPEAQTCQRVDPEAFPAEPPVCHSASTSCDDCRDDQFCDNDPNTPRCWPQCRVDGHCDEGWVCVEGFCQLVAAP